MRVLSIGSDEHVFEKGSAVRIRQEAYAKVLGHVDLVVRSKKVRNSETGEPLSLFAAYASTPLPRLWRARSVALQFTKPDVVTVQDPFETGLIGWMVAKRFRVPLHVQVHTDILSPEFSRQSLLNRMRVPIARFVLKRADRIRVVSEKIRTQIERTYHPHAEVTVLPIFVDIESLRAADAQPELSARFEKYRTKLLVVARLESEKNTGLAIRSFAQAAPNDACLIVVGDGSERKSLEEFARTLHVADRVFFEGTQLSLQYYKLADLVLVPSRYEGYGLTIVEALAAGKPVLATDVGIAREAGAIVTREQAFAAELKKWFESGPRTAQLKGYPYMNLDEYVRAYCADIEACLPAR